MLYCFHNSYSILNRHYPREDKKKVDKKKELVELNKKQDLSKKRVHFDDDT